MEHGAAALTPTWWTGPLAQFVSSVIVAIIAAVVTASVTVRRTKSETRWKAKYDAYAHVLSAIEDMRFWAEEHYSSSVELPSIGSEQLKAATERYYEAKRVLWSYVNVGALVLSDDARDLLDELMSAIAREEFRFDQESMGEDEFPEHCDKIRSLISSRVPPVVAVAKKDLGVSTTWRRTMVRRDAEKQA